MTATKDEVVLAELQQALAKAWVSAPATRR
jgi:hypothetical protein